MSDWDIVVHHCDLAIVGEQRYFALAVEYVKDGVTVTDPDSGATLHGHVIAEDVVELYLAMYQINPTAEGLDEVVEIILRESMLDDWTRDEEMTVGPLATDADTARAHKLQRVRAHKGAGVIRGVRGRSPHRALGPAHEVIADSGADDPIEFFKREAPVDPEVVLAKHTEVAQLRRSVSADRARKRDRDAILRDRSRRPTPQPVNSRSSERGPA